MTEVRRVFDEFPGKKIEPAQLDKDTLMYDVNGVQAEINYEKRTYLMHQERFLRKYRRGRGDNYCVFRSF